MELIRKIILCLEESNTSWQKKLQDEGYTLEQIGYHSYLLIDGGFAEGNSNRTFNATYPLVHLNNLTWQGHEFADASRNDSIWNKAMERVKEKGDTIPIGVLTMLLTSLLKSAFGLV